MLERSRRFLSCANVLRISFVIFMISNLVLFYFLFEREEEKSGFYKQRTSSLPASYLKILHKHFVLFDNEWRLKSSFTSRIYNVLNCSSLLSVENIKFVATGWTKATFRTNLNNRTVILKIVNENGYDVASCVKETRLPLFECYMTAASKILQEIVVLNNIIHENVIKVVGYCIPNDPDYQNYRHTVAVFEESGEAVDVIKLLQSSWEDRLRISFGLSKLLKHLANSSYGSIALNDFRRQQFVSVDGELKLVDVDDIGFQEPKCTTRHCCIEKTSGENATICVPCISQECKGFNERLNIIRTGKHFINHILPHGAPLQLNKLIKRITNAYQFALTNATYIFQETEKLALEFKSGLYRIAPNASILSGYRMVKNKDLSAQFDYRCQLTLSFQCMISVFDAEEASEICSLDTRCRAFIFTNITTWTGPIAAEPSKCRSATCYI